jgi:hypothetical protein
MLQGTPNVITLTTGTSFRIPNDWNLYNSIEALGGGGSSSSGSSTLGGGGGGAYVRSDSINFTPGELVFMTIGAGGGNTFFGSASGNTANITNGVLEIFSSMTGNVYVGATIRDTPNNNIIPANTTITAFLTGTSNTVGTYQLSNVDLTIANTSWASYVVYAEGGFNGATIQNVIVPGGSAANSIGQIKFSGGTGGSGLNTWNGGAGGGAASPLGAGKNGGSMFGSIQSQGGGGAGGPLSTDGSSSATGNYGPNPADDRGSGGKGPLGFGGPFPFVSGPSWINIRTTSAPSWTFVRTANSGAGGSGTDSGRNSGFTQAAINATGITFPIWTNSYTGAKVGPGGGGGGGWSSSGNPGAGASFGGGAGGGRSGGGAQGLIVITYLSNNIRPSNPRILGNGIPVMYATTPNTNIGTSNNYNVVWMIN